MHLNLTKSKLFAIIKDPKEFDSVFVALEATECINSIFGLNYWKKVKNSNGTIEFKLADRINFAQIFRKFDIIMG